MQRRRRLREADVMQKLCNRGNAGVHHRLDLAMNTLLRRTEPCVCVAKTIYRRRKDRMKSTHDGSVLPYVVAVCAAHSRRSLYIRAFEKLGSNQVDSQRQLKVRFANLFSGKRGYRAEDIACLLFSCAHNALVVDWCAAPPRRRCVICITPREPAGLWIFPCDRMPRESTYDKINSIIFLN